jgi:dipeptidyl aminopeptidase/acylaminoacyl peptidase
VDRLAAPYIQRRTAPVALCPDFRMIRPTALLLLAALAPLATLPAQAKPLLTTADYGQWEQPGAPRLSPRGDWVAVPVSRVNEENELRLIGGPRDTTIVVPFASAPLFSASNTWVAMSIGVSPAERERLTKDKKPIRNGVQLRNLATGQVIAEPEITATSFSADGRYATLTRYAAEGRRTNDVLVYDLTRGTRLTFVNVGEFAWADAGALLAVVTADNGPTGNAVQLYDARANTLRVLESAAAPYRGLAWRRRSTDLAVLKSRPDKAFKDTAHVLLTWSNVAAGPSAPAVLDPATAAGFPKGTRIAEYRRPAWSRDGALLYVGVRAREAVADAIKKSDEKVSDVEIWHTNDVRMFAQQKAQEAQDLRTTLLTAWRRSDNRVLPIGTDLNEQAVALEGGRYATEIDRKPYGWEWKFGRGVQDVYVVDLSTGARTKVLQRVRHYAGADPTGTRLAWSDGKDYWVVDLPTGKRTNLTASLTRAGVDFVDRDDDHPTDIPHMFTPAGFTRDGSALLVYDMHDVWRLALDGSGTARLTSGAKEGITHRLVNFAPFTASADERAIDVNAPLYFTLRGRRTGQTGYARRTSDGTVTRLVLADAGYGALQKADSAAVFAFTRQRYDASPNVYVGADLATAKAVTNTNAFQSKYAWGKVELVNFTSAVGQPLQALLYYPANYDPSKKYPMIVYTYERLTQGLHNYVAPSRTSYYNTTVFLQNGYFVLMPDIVFRPREPGLGTQYAVEPAVRSVLARGLVDPKRVGHVGHSQGGYEAAFLGTHSTLFATTVVGSGITDMISFAGQLHWQGGSAEFDHWETGQFRMQVAPWEDFKAMLDNSPLATVHKMPAKSMLLEIGSEDGTVDPRQGSLFYNYARRAGKQVVLLTYPGEGHGLSKKENQMDYQRRILDWFGHYLKGDPAPKWITDGQTALERRAILDANK